MEKQFIPYELALKLKELGFNEECFGTWWFRPDIHRKGDEDLIFKLTKYFELPEYEILAPTWQQAFDWFREKHNLGYSIHPITLESFVTNINNADLILLGDFKTYEEARLGCFKKLIELCSQNKI